MTAGLTESHNFVDQSHLRSEYLYHLLTLHKLFNSEGYLRSGCRNGSQCTSLSYEKEKIGCRH